jgi:hypothetical protein
MNSATFWDVTPCSPAEFGDISEECITSALLAALLATRSAYFSTMKMEPECSSETSVEFYSNKRCSIRVDTSFHAMTNLYFCCKARCWLLECHAHNRVITHKWPRTSESKDVTWTSNVTRRVNLNLGSSRHTSLHNFVNVISKEHKTWRKVWARMFENTEVSTWRKKCFHNKELCTAHASNTTVPSNSSYSVFLYPRIPDNFLYIYCINFKWVTTNSTDHVRDW